jgi:hypothetical protein
MLLLNAGVGFWQRQKAGPSASPRDVLLIS